MSFLHEKGWKDVVGSPAVLRRGTSLICVYVDDIAAAGPERELALFWKELGERFPIGARDSCKEFLGAVLQWGTSRDGRTVDIDMHEYVAEIVSEFQNLYPSVPGKKPLLVRTKTPMNDDLRKESDILTKPELRVQKVIGMLLWISRVSRPDVAYAVSRLGTSVSRWTPVCEQQLARCVGYLWQTERMVLRLHVHLDDARAGFVTIPEPIIGSTLEEAVTPVGLCPSAHSDADWQHPRSQSGYIYGLRGGAGSWLPIAWGSRKQSITADSSGVSELIAAHYAVRSILGLHCGTFPDSVLCVAVDNATVLRISRTGLSKQLDVLEVKPIGVRLGVLRDLRGLGVISVVFVRSARNSADGLTKALDMVKLQEACVLFGLTLDYTR
jgi:hypothetical protein